MQLTKLVSCVLALYGIGLYGPAEHAEDRLGTGREPVEAFTSTAPAVRFENLVMTDAGGDVVVTDPASHHLHYLNQPAATVCRLCDGHASVAGIARRAGMTDGMVRAALAKLADAKLLQDELASDLRAPAPSPRAFRKQVARAVTFPTVLSVIAPMAFGGYDPNLLYCGVVPSDSKNYDVCCRSHCRNQGKEMASAVLVACAPNPNGGYVATVDCTCTT
jgi:hypothetical protein